LCPNFSGFICSNLQMASYAIFPRHKITEMFLRIFNSSCKYTEQFSISFRVYGYS